MNGALKPIWRWTAAIMVVAMIGLDYLPPGYEIVRKAWIAAAMILGGALGMHIALSRQRDAKWGRLETIELVLWSLAVPPLVFLPLDQNHVWLIVLAMLAVAAGGRLIAEYRKRTLRRPESER